MPSTSFSFKQPKDRKYYLVLALLFVCFSIFLFVQIFSYQGISFNTIIYLIVPAPFLLAAIMLYIVYVLRRQYRQVDEGKHLELDESNTVLQVTRDNHTFTIHDTDIKDIEVYDSWTPIRLFIMLGYIKINLLNGQCLIITRFTASKYDLANMLHDISTTRTSRFMNKIDISDVEKWLC